MKRTLTAILLALLCITPRLFGQSFFPGIVLLTGGVEFGGAAVALDDPSPTAINSGVAMFRNLPMALEVGIAERMGIGIQYRIDKYLNHTDSVRAKGNDYNLMFNYHFVVTHQTNSFIGFRTGLSDFSFEKPRTGETFEKKGGNLQLVAGVNMMFRHRLGLQLTFGANSFLYPNGKLVNPLSPTPIPYGVTIVGIDLGMGLLFVL